MTVDTTHPIERLVIQKRTAYEQAQQKYEEALAANREVKKRIAAMGDTADPTWRDRRELQDAKSAQAQAKRLLNERLERLREVEAAFDLRRRPFQELEERIGQFKAANGPRPARMVHRIIDVIDHGLGRVMRVGDDVEQDAQDLLALYADLGISVEASHVDAVAKSIQHVATEAEKARQALDSLPLPRDATRP